MAQQLARPKLWHSHLMYSTSLSSFPLSVLQNLSVPCPSYIYLSVLFPLRFPSPCFPLSLYLTPLSLVLIATEPVDENWKVFFWLRGQSGDGRRWRRSWARISEFSSGRTVEQILIKLFPASISSGLCFHARFTKNEDTEITEIILLLFHLYFNFIITWFFLNFRCI